MHKLLFLRILSENRCEEDNALFNDNFFSKMDFKLLTKPSTSWRTFIDLKNIEYCEALRGKHLIGLMNGYVNLMRQLVPGLVPESCPVAIGKYFNNNTIINYNINYDEFRGTFTTTLLPNGFYRLFIRLKTDKDPQGFCLWLNCEFYVWHNNGSSV